MRKILIRSLAIVSLISLLGFEKVTLADSINTKQIEEETKDEKLKDDTKKLKKIKKE